MYTKLELLAMHLRIEEKRKVFYAYEKKTQKQIEINFKQLQRY
jgi:hypothetical protein